MNEIEKAVIEAANEFIDRVDLSEKIVYINLVARSTGEDVCGGMFLRPTEDDIRREIQDWSCFLRGWSLDQLDIIVS